MLGDGVIPLNKLEVPIGTLSVYTNSVVNYPPIPPEAPTRRSVASEMAFVNFCVLPIFRSLQIVSTQSRIHRVFNDCLPLGASARQGYSHVLSKRDRLEEWRYMCTCFLLADEVKWIRQALRRESELQCGNGLRILKVNSKKETRRAHLLSRRNGLSSPLNSQVHHSLTHSRTQPESKMWN